MLVSFIYLMKKSVCMYFQRSDNSPQLHLCVSASVRTGQSSQTAQLLMQQVKKLILVLQRCGLRWTNDKFIIYATSQVKPPV